MHERILMAVDDSPASEKALAYVARMVTGRPDHYVHLVHVLPQRAAGGADTEQPSAARDAGTRELLQTMSARLHAAGLAQDHVDTGTLAVGHDASLVEGLLDAARDQSCSTLVVGRNSLSPLRELFHGHPADQLVRTAQGFTLWIVE